MADTPTTAQKIAAEVIGTFMLVFFGCGTAIMTSRGPGFDYLGTALAFGLTVLFGAYAFGRVSGAHFNPAVTVGAALGGRMAWRQMPLYFGSQLVGGLVAGLMLFILVQGFDGYDVGTDGLAQNGFRDGRRRLRRLGGLPARADPHRGLRLGDPGGHRCPQRAPGAGAGRDRPGADDGPPRLDLRHGHLGQPGPFDRRRASSPGPTRSIQLWLFILAPLAGGAIAGITYPLLFGHGSDPVPGSGLRRAAAAVPGYGAPDQFQQEWNQGTSGAGDTVIAQEPIIQDGWQWDHEAQEWKPLEQFQQPARPDDPTLRPQPSAQGPDVSSLDPGGPSRVKVRTRPTPSS